jgi:hypothetical protein
MALCREYSSFQITCWEMDAPGFESESTES